MYRNEPTDLKGNGMDEKKYREKITEEVERKVRNSFMNASIIAMSFAISTIINICADLSFIDAVSVFCLTAVFFWALQIFLTFIVVEYKKEE